MRYVSPALPILSPQHIQAVARCVPLIQPCYLEKLAGTQSGVRNLPQTRDFEFAYPQRQLNRGNLFRGLKFIIFGDNVDRLSDLISSCGGEIHNIDQATDPGLLIVDSDFEISELDRPLYDCLLIEMKMVLRMVFTGSIDLIRDIPKVTIGEFRHKRHIGETLPYSDSWITSAGSCDSRISHIGASNGMGVKKFKKRHASNNQNQVSLEVWDGKDATRKRRDPCSIPLNDRNIVDDWFDSYSTQ